MYNIRLVFTNWSERSACASAEVAIVLGIIGPSGAVQTVSDSRRPLFLVFFFTLVLLLLLLSEVVAFLPERRQLGF